MTRKLVIIGAGMASGRMLEHLFEAAPFAYAVTLFNAEPPGNYNRLLLSPVLSGEKTYAEIVTHDADWYEAQGVTTRFGGQVSAFRPVQTATRLKVTGVDLFCAGDFADAPGREDIIFRDPGRGIYKRLVIAGDKLLSVKKADLPSIWADLNAAGMVSGHACSKGLRTVKTCVGTEFCRFGTQDSTGLGIRLEKLLWGSWTPAKVKLGVSGCPRNCAVATCKDVGVVCVDSGFEISVAGAAGMDVKETEPLRKVTTEAEVLETVAAFVQLYRENARYLHRISKWVAKVGLTWCQDQIADPANRRALYDRFMLSQCIYQTDPWAEHARPAERAKWSGLADLTLEAAE